jgi:hypothetical protein
VINNIWNWTKNAASLTGPISHTCKSGAKVMSGSQLFYACSLGAVTTGKYVATVKLPFTVQLETETFASAKGNSSVAFYYNIYQGNTKKNGSEYDVVTFSGSGGSPAFKVGGLSTQHYSGSWYIPNDVENVLSGYPSSGANGCGGCVIVDKIAATMQLYYLPKNGNSLTLVTHAFSAGSETAEMVVNVHVEENGKAHSATIVSGTDDNVELW